MPTETTISITSVIFGGVLDRHPDLKICFAHGGGSFPGSLGRIEKGWHCRPDLFPTCPNPPSSYLSKIYVDSLVHSPEALRLLCEVMGTKNIVLGSDYPFPLGEEYPGKLVETSQDLTPDQKQDILARNALRFLGIDESDFTHC